MVPARRRFLPSAFYIMSTYAHMTREQLLKPNYDVHPPIRPLIESSSSFLAGGFRSKIDLSQKINYYSRISFFLRSVTLDVNHVAFVRLQLFCHPRDLYVFACAALSEISRFQFASTTRRPSATVCSLE